MSTPAPAAHTLYTARQRWTFLAILFLVATSNYADRNIVAVLLEPIKREFGATDTQLGLLSGAAFAVLYSTLGVPVARWADRGHRPQIIALSISVWSLMCAVCGMAQNFWQLVLARVGVGVGEAGASPPSQSLIIDYFPPEQRARAVSIYTAGASAGYLVGFVVGAQIAAALGWRAAFVLLGLPGLVVAVVVAWGLREPRTVLGQPQPAGKQESFRNTLQVLWRKPAYRYTLVGLTLYGFFAYGVLVFVPAFLVRVLKVNMAVVGSTYGGVHVVVALLGTLGGGWLADRLVRRNLAWLLRLPALGLLIAFPFYLVSFVVTDYVVFLVLTSFGGLLLIGAVPSVFVAAHAVCGSERRAMSVAILLFFMVLVGSTLGPLAVGLVSDGLKATRGVSGLADALAWLTLVMLLCAVSFWRGAKHIAQDSES